MQDGREQLQIQDFPDGGINPIGSASTYYLATVLPKYCMKMKEIGPRASKAPVLDPPMALQLLLQKLNTVDGSMRQ